MWQGEKENREEGEVKGEVLRGEERRGDGKGKERKGEIRNFTNESWE